MGNWGYNSFKWSYNPTYNWLGAHLVGCFYWDPLFQTIMFRLHVGFQECIICPRIGDKHTSILGIYFEQILHVVGVFQISQAIGEILKV